MKLDQNESRRNEAVENLLTLIRDLKGKFATTGAVDHQRRRATVEAVLASLLQSSISSRRD